MANELTIMIMSNNNHELLAECIDRIRKYTDGSYDLVIVDDASETPYDPKDYGDNTTIVRMPRRSNCCNLRNVGMEMAKTPFVFWLDNDTMVDGPSWNKSFVDLMRSDKTIGCVGQNKDSRMIRKPYFPLTQAECMVEYQFSLDYNHLNNECDFFTSYCMLVRKDAYRPAYCYGMPTPMLDPDTGANIKMNGYRVVVGGNIPIFHHGSRTPRPYGMNYHHYLSRNFTKWFQFWEPHAKKVFELYSGRDAQFSHNANEPSRNGSRGEHDSRDEDFEDIPQQYQYHED